MAHTTDALPRWDLSNVYAGLESPELAQALAQVTEQLNEMEAFFAASGIGAETAAVNGTATLTTSLTGALERFNALYAHAFTVRAYLWSFITTDSFNATAKKLFSQFQISGVRMEQLFTQFQGWLGSVAAHLPAVLEQPGVAREHAFFVNEMAELSRYLMSQAEESLAAELNVSGVQAWSKLQGTVCSQILVPFERNGQTEKLPLPALQNLYHEADREVRRRAYEAELAALEAVKEPLAAAMNGVKGAVITLNRKRGFRDNVQPALIDSRIDHETLEAMLTAMRASFPAFRRYLKHKAKRLDLPALAWYDLLAPVSHSERHFTFAEAEQFVVEQFGTFSPQLAEFARQAFTHHWVDAEPRSGKRGGAFCMGIPALKESRVLMNYDGSFDSVSTLAHELGHGFHNQCYYAAGKTLLNANSPMTLAETASIFCETIITDAALAKAASAQDELSILETYLIGATQVVVDITSRFVFEKEVFERRAQAELSAEDFCDIMLRAQAETYGDGLQTDLRHAYMWTWKPHYYRSDLSFYNYPYAFGMLFGLGLYSIYQQRGAAFVADYENLLANTGSATVAELAGRFGIEVRSPVFWEGSLKVIEKRIDRYCEL